MKTAPTAIIDSTSAENTITAAIIVTARVPPLRPEAAEQNETWIV